MSGGHFNYYQHHIEEVADKLEKDIADIEYAKSIGTVKKKEVYGHLLDVLTGKKYWPYWLLDACNRYDNREDIIKYIRAIRNIHKKDGKMYYDETNARYEVVIYYGENEQWADGKWHFEVDDNEVVEELKKGLKILRMASIYAQRIDWLISCDDGESSFKKRLKDELDELESKPLIDYEYWYNVFKNENDE